jgi:hypothetical protein
LTTMKSRTSFDILGKRLANGEQTEIFLMFIF